MQIPNPTDETTQAVKTEVAAVYVSKKGFLKDPAFSCVLFSEGESLLSLWQPLSSLF